MVYAFGVLCWCVYHSKVMKKGVIIVTGILLLVMLVFFVQSLDMTVYTKQNTPGPGFAPKLYLGMGLIAALTIILNTVKSKENYAGVKTNKLVIIITVLSILYITLIPMIGYIVSTFIAFLAIYKMFGINDWKLILSVSAGFLIVVYVVFVKFLMVPIPKGIVF